jgi:hypothetical protein
VCVPNDNFTGASTLFASHKDFEPAGRILPQLYSLLHTYPRFKQKGVNFRFYILPASEYFISDLSESMLEFSINNKVPYPKLEPFAQSLVSTQRWPELCQLVDGMDIDEGWGFANLQLGTPSEVELKYVEEKNKKIMSSYDDYPDSQPVGSRLSAKKLLNRSKKWKEIVAGKERRISPYLFPERYATKYRRKGSEDPRLKRNNAV